MGVFSQLKEKHARRAANLLELADYTEYTIDYSEHTARIRVPVFETSVVRSVTKPNIARVPSSSEELKALLLRFLLHANPHPHRSELSVSSILLPVSSVRLTHALRQVFQTESAGRPRSDWLSETAVHGALRDLHAELGDALKIAESDTWVVVTEINTAAITQSPLELPSKKRRIEEPIPKRDSKPFPPIPDDAEALAMTLSARQRMLVEAGEELRELLCCPTVRQRCLARKFVNKHRTAQEFCSFGSRMDCRNAARNWRPCEKIHFRKLLHRWTDPCLGDCSYLDTCRHMNSCRYVHYALDLSHDQVRALKELGIENCGTDTRRFNEVNLKGIDYPPQWIQCDLRTMDLSIFQGTAAVIMADPPWDIHMELPYGTMTDEEMKGLRVQDAQRDGMIFLWVTGRASELARECLERWGYNRVEEIIWVKTNQLQRIIRTGRTGHWINHSKEHCLVGIKGNLEFNRNLDCDVIVSEVRETSRKPDEIYNLIERMFPNSLKVELFGRPHNIHPNWITLGNQLDGCHLCCDELVRKYNNKYPDTPCVAFDRNETPNEHYTGKETKAAWKPPKTLDAQPWRPGDAPRPTPESGDAPRHTPESVKLSSAPVRVSAPVQCLASSETVSNGFVIPETASTNGFVPTVPESVVFCGPPRVDTPFQPSTTPPCVDTPFQPSTTPPRVDTPFQPSATPPCVDTPFQPSTTPPCVDTPFQPSTTPPCVDTSFQPSTTPPCVDTSFQPSTTPPCVDTAFAPKPRPPGPVAPFRAPSERPTCEAPFDELPNKLAATTLASGPIRPKGAESLANGEAKELNRGDASMGSASKSSAPGNASDQMAVKSTLDLIHGIRPKASAKSNFPIPVKTAPKSSALTPSPLIAGSPSLAGTVAKAKPGVLRKVPAAAMRRLPNK